MINRSEVGGVLLAGGKASRMGYRDKALRQLHGEPLLNHVIRRAEPQVRRLVLSVNHSVARYRAYALPLVADVDDGYHGPLLGIYSAMRWFQKNRQVPGINYLACFAADVPEFPPDVVARLARQLDCSSSRVAYVVHAGQMQPLFSLWHLSLADKLREAIDSGLYGPKLVFASLDAVAVEIEAAAAGSFYNINTSEELRAAMKLIPKQQP